MDSKEFERIMRHIQRENARTRGELNKLRGAIDMLAIYVLTNILFIGVLTVIQIIIYLKSR